MVLFITLRQWKRASAKYGGVSAEYLKFRKRVSGYGGRVHPSSSTDEVMKEAVETGRFNHAEVQRLIDGYRFLRFSGKTDREALKVFYRVSKRLGRQKRTGTNRSEEERRYS